MEGKNADYKLACENMIALDRKLAIECADKQAIFSYTLDKYVKAVKDVKPQYHYTDINGFMGIMQNKELWATSTRFLNDKNEYIEGLLLAQKIAGDYSKTCADKEKKFLNSFQRMIQDRIDKGCNQDIYSISFCECGDLLSQWRGYGKQGGVSLGFDLTYYEMEYDGQKALGIYNFMDRFHYENSSDEKKKLMNLCLPMASS